VPGVLTTNEPDCSGRSICTSLPPDPTHTHERDHLPSPSVQKRSVTAMSSIFEQRLLRQSAKSAIRWRGIN
jgi:hypothetical protein